jgi:opacity protein-like surface antigen
MFGFAIIVHPFLGDILPNIKSHISEVVMKKLLLVVLMVAVAANFAFAGDAKPMTKAGEKALLFTINGLGAFGVASMPTFSVPAGQAVSAENYGGIGFKYYFAKDFAGRLALNVGSRSTTTKGATNFSDEKESDFVVGFAPAIELHLVNAGPVTMFVGAAAQIGMVTSSHTPSVATGATASETKRSGTVFGVGVLMGVEFFPWENISLGAEYQLGFRSISGKTEPPSPAPSVDSPSITEIGTQCVSVTLGVYF